MRTHDPDESAVACSEFYFPHRLEVLHDRRDFGMSLSTATLGPVSVGVLGYSGEVVIQTRELETGYQVNVPLTGHLHTWIGSVEVDATPSCAAVYPPDRPARLQGWSNGGRLFGMKIDRSAIEDKLTELTDGAVHGPVRLGESLDLSHGPGRQWWSLSRSLIELTADPDGPLVQPMVARPLADALVGALLQVVDHPHHAALHRAVPPPCPATIRLAVEMLEAEPQAAWTVPDLAVRVGLSVRGLQVGFARHLGRSPTVELRRIRLERVRAELRAADPAHRTVAAVAHRWGFVHLGRFAAEYRRRFGTTPSADLHTP